MKRSQTGWSASKTEAQTTRWLKHRRFSLATRGDLLVTAPPDGESDMQPTIVVAVKTPGYRLRQSALSKNPAQDNLLQAKEYATYLKMARDRVDEALTAVERDLQDVALHKVYVSAEALLHRLVLSKSSDDEHEPTYMLLPVDAGVSRTVEPPHPPPKPRKGSLARKP